MAAINTPANEAGWTTATTVQTGARLVQRRNLNTAPLISPLMRVSVSYPDPDVDDLTGRPLTDKLTADSETISEWGHPRVFISNQDVSAFRGATTAINAATWARYGNSETLDLTFPNITPFDAVGARRASASTSTHPVAWLTESAPVRIERVTSSGTRTTIWAGLINAIRPSQDGIGVNVTCHGTLLDATYRIAKPSVRSKRGAAVEDIGHDIAAMLNQTRGRWQFCHPVDTGVQSVKDGAYEDVTSYVQSLLTLAVPEPDPLTGIVSGWTVWCDVNGKPSIIKTADIPGRKTITLVAGQDGVQDNLSKDTVAGTTAIYGTGVTKGGAVWRNTRYPLASNTKPRFPLDDPSGAFGQGTTDEMVLPAYNGTTNVGGITNLQTRLNALGHAITVTGKFGPKTAAAVKARQKKWGLKQNGIVDAKFWSKLIGQRDCTAGAWIAPLYAVPATQPRLYNSHGKDTGPNPSYDPSLRKLEKFYDFGDGITLTQAVRAATSIVKRDGDRPIEGDLTLTVCPPECARWDIRPGDVVNYRGKWGANLSLLVHRVSWNLGDDPSVSLEVSTRDMDTNQLAAEMNRLASRRAVGSKTGAGVPLGDGSLSSNGALSVDGDGLGGGIKGTKSVTGDYTLSAFDEDYLLLLQAPGVGYTLTVPTDAAAAFPIGAQVHLSQVSGADSSYWGIQGASGVTVNSFNGTRLAGLYASATLIKTSVNAWTIVGAMSE